MKNIIILQNSNVSFGLNAEKIYQPQKYNLHLIVNQFGSNILKSQNQEKYYKNIFVIERFDIETMLFLLTDLIQGGDDFELIARLRDLIEEVGNDGNLINPVVASKKIRSYENLYELFRRLLPAMRKDITEPWQFFCFSGEYEAFDYAVIHLKMKKIQSI